MQAEQRYKQNHAISERTAKLREIMVSFGQKVRVKSECKQYLLNQPATNIPKSLGYPNANTFTSIDVGGGASEIHSTH